MFLHAGPAHLLFNMYVLFIFGPLVEDRIGSRRFLLVYLLSGLIAALLSTFFYEAALGASGAIMGIIGVTIMILPDLQVLFLFAIPMSMRTAGIILAAVDIFGIFTPTGVANIAHLAGMGTGLLYGFYLVSKRKKFRKRFNESPEKNKSRRAGRAGGHEPDMSHDDLDEYLKYGRI
ncbi:MAG: rhomboid family intramembrane serine protease [Candidatus Woesearchaeota archaeon]